MSFTTMLIITLSLFMVGNIFGIAYSFLVLNTKVFEKYRIQKKPYKKGLFKDHLPLYLFNVLLLGISSTIGMYFLYDSVNPNFPSWWVLLLQILIIFLADDVWFYFFHRWMHTNKTVLKKVHSIHHRAHTPFPLDYLYVHPFEWMFGIIGAVVAILALINFWDLSIYSFWGFVFLRNIHEIHIHSDLKLPLLKNIPLISPVEDHDVHHEKLDGNYASTFQIWDRIMKTRFKK